MRELIVQVRKDLKLLSTDARFIFLIVALAAIAFILAVQACSSYVSTAKGSSIVTSATLVLQQKVNLGSYWNMLLAIDSAIFIVAGAMSMTAEKDGGMLRYILTSGCDKKRFFTSKFLVLTAMVAIAVTVSLVAYLIAFAMMDMPSLGLDVLLASMIFPALMMLVFAALGLFLASVAKKKSESIVMAIFLFFLLTAMFSITMSIGMSEAYKVNPHITVNNASEYFPPLIKAMYLSNPVMLTQGTYLVMGVAPDDFANMYSLVMYDVPGGLALGLGMVFMFLGLGYLVFRTERLDDAIGNQGMWGRLKGK